MNKEKFLNELEKKLSVLSKEERTDILDEYNDILLEKIKHGKTETEAVSEFGSIEELAKEILSAYKIDPKYSQSDKNIADNVEDIIKKGAKKISDVTEDVAKSFKNSDFKWTTNNVVEIVIKVILLLFALAILKIPFHLISEIGSEVFSVSLSPFDNVITFIWKFIVEIAYFVISVLLIINLISKYIVSSKDSYEKKENDELKEYKVEKEVKEKKSKTSSTDKLSEIAITIIKIFCIICFLIPAWGVLFGVSISIALGIYLIVKGIMVYGIVILLIGIFMFISLTVDSIYNVLFNNKKISFYPFVVSIIICIIGLFLTIDYIDDYKYIDSLNKERYESKTVTYKTEIDEKTTIYNNYEIIIDETLKNNEIFIEVNYFNKYTDVYITKDDYNNQIEINKNYISDFRFDKNIIEDLKNKVIYNYGILHDIDVLIHANSNTAYMIRG